MGIIPRPFRLCLAGLFLLVGSVGGQTLPPTIAPSAFWKHEVTFPNDGFRSFGTDENIRWIKFTLLLPPYDPTLVYFQDSRLYTFHQQFATRFLDPFLGVTVEQFNTMTLFAMDQRAILGAVLFPPGGDGPIANEVGIQFVRQDPFSREEIVTLFSRVKAQIQGPNDLAVFYMPTYEQQAVAEAEQDWLVAQGVPVASTTRWTQGNICYAPGWALGTLKYIPAAGIDAAYRSGTLGPADILLTDGIPAELPFVAGIASLVPSTPNSHVAILSQTYNVPFAYLACAEYAENAQLLVDRTVVYSAYEDGQGQCQVHIIDVSHLTGAPILDALLAIKRPTPLRITPMTQLGTLGVSADDLLPADIGYVGGKAANFGLLRTAIPASSPRALVLGFDLWQTVLDLPVIGVPELTLAPGGFMVFWADGDSSQGPTHANFRLDRKGESIVLVDRDGQTVLDAVHFGTQETDRSYGRFPDGGDTWMELADPTPGQSNVATPAVLGNGLVINEWMADNEGRVSLPTDPNAFPDWFELYNTSDRSIVLNGLFITDNPDNPTKWRIPPAQSVGTLREAIADWLRAYPTYPASNRQALATDLAAIRGLFTSEQQLPFPEALRDAVLAALTNPAYGFDPNAMLRFRSSTNVEDSEDFTGAGLYDSYSGCLADTLDTGQEAPCACDPNETSPRTVWTAMRKTLASFYNDNAFQERLRRDVNEAEVGVSLLIHHAFPDTIELANGVATFTVNGPSENRIAHLVTQKDAVSVTNPEGSALPEEVTIEVSPSGAVVPPAPRNVTQSSSLVVLGGTVMDWPRDYKDLVELIDRVSDRYRDVTGKAVYTLDLEYKKVAPGGAVLPEGGLVIKQVRPVPMPDPTQAQDAFLLNVPVTYEVYTSGFILTDSTDVFASHRLKMQLRLETRNLELSEDTLAEGLYACLDMMTAVGQQAGPVASLPGYAQTWSAREGILTWQQPTLDNPRTYTLRTTGLTPTVGANENPIRTLPDLGTFAANVPYRCLSLDVTYAQPVTSWYQHVQPSDPPSGMSTTQTNRIYLWSPPAPSTSDLLQERSVTHNGVTFFARFTFPPPPGEFAQWGVNNTAPLLRWEGVTITGLTSVPLGLTGTYALTYCPEKHNLIENILCEPQQDPTVAPALLAELQAQDIRFVHVTIDNDDPNRSVIRTHGF